MKRLSYLNITLITIALICVTGMFNHAHCEALTAPELSEFAITPGKATANSVYKIEFTYKNEDGLALTEPLESLIVYVDDVAVPIDFKSLLNAGTIVEGQTITIRLSAGLKTEVTGTYPADPADAAAPEDVIYNCPRLIADTASGKYGDPKAHTVKIVAHYMSDTGDPAPADPVVAPTYVDLELPGTSVTVHDSFVSLPGYGGIEGSRDHLKAYPFAYPGWGDTWKDPLIVLPAVDQFPDDGSSSSDYIFSVHYYNADGRIPTPWGTADADDEAVLLRMGPADAHPAPNFNDYIYMYHEDLADTNFNDYVGVIYTRYVLPVGRIGCVDVSNDATNDPWYERNWEFDADLGKWRFPWYISLSPGDYQYYFTCTDDDITEAVSPSNFYPSAPYTPSLFDPANDLFGTYWEVSDGEWWSHEEGFNNNTFLDMPTYFPGPAFESNFYEGLPNGYPYPSWDSSWLSGDETTHPMVNPGLEACYEDSTGALFEYPLGSGRFLGTMYPYKFSINPVVPYQVTLVPLPGQPVNSTLGFWSDTSAVTESSQVEFRVVYRQSRDVNDPSDTGWTPTGVWLRVYDDWEPTGVISGKGTPTLKSYQMILDSGPFVDGIDKWATYKVTLGAGTQLSPGSHCYYFEASDGTRTAHFPRRPDSITYDGATWIDLDCPGGVGNTEGCPEDNDVINGPYVNRKCTLTAPSLSPANGPAGTDFVFRVTYTDLDGPTVAQDSAWIGPRGQRPYTANVIIQTVDGGTLANGGAQRCSMQKTDATDINYTDGVVYELHAASVPGLVLQPGTRHYYFEFTDDWGRQMDPNLRISGELTTLTQGTFGFAGPLITANTKPVLYSGSCSAPDGSNNSATEWAYKVTYKDENNQPPAYIFLYIGKYDPDTGEITWDSGHAMTAANPADVVYTDGKIYTYSKRLVGDAVNPVNYYYCFVASDGIDVAQYDLATSPSAHTVWNDEILTSYNGSDQIFSFAHEPIVAGIPPNITNYDEPLVYIDGTLQTSGYVFDNFNGRVTFTNPVAAGEVVTAKYWFGVAGPTVVGGNNAPELSSGKVLPVTGYSNTLFTYTVKYKDTDGTSGQPPAYINVVIDGQFIAMSPSIAGTPNYKQGVEYKYQTTLANGTHTYYFEASDGEDIAIFDANGYSSSANPIPGIAPITGPYVNDLPTLTNGTITPNVPGVDYTTGQYFEYSVTYTDQNNDAPDAGYPVAYIDNPEEYSILGSINPVTLAAEVRNGTITLGGIDTVAMTITDRNQNWTVDKFKGMPVEITSSGMRTVYIIGSNDDDTLSLITTSVADILVGDTFTIGKLIMEKADVSDNDYTDGVIYVANVPGLGVGNHSAHFRSVTTELIGSGAQTRVTLLREPDPDEIDGPTVTKVVPAGNHAPTLTNCGVLPTTGTSATPFVFSATYTDEDDDAPIPRVIDNVIGYMRLMIRKGASGSFTPYDMTVVGVPDYVAGAAFTITLNGLAPGTYNYYFEASDGWYTIKSPATGVSSLNVNSPPELSEPLPISYVTPTSGNTGMTYIYSVMYKDANGDPPSTLYVVIDGVPTDIKAYAVLGGSYTTGMVYRYTKPANTLLVGSHTYQFTASDGLDAAVPVPDPAASGPTIHSNDQPGDAPILNAVGTGVNPTIGYDTDPYTYSVIYADQNGDTPKYVKVYIDGTGYDMTSTKANPTSDDFISGVTYTKEKSDMTEGSHLFYFEASDWDKTVRDPASGTISGPDVTLKLTAAITVLCHSPLTLGETAAIGGTITPPMSVGLKIIITSPVNAVTEVDADAVNGSYTYSWKPDRTGTWKLKTTWAGAGNYRASESAVRSVVVNGPSYTVNGLDMISIPLTPNFGFGYPDAVFGIDPPYALAKWLPASSTYKLYSLLPDYRSDSNFPWITPGEAYWIKTEVSKTFTVSGSLVSTAADFTMNLGVGWNQVGCPFPNEVDWSNLKVRNGVNLVSLSTAAANGWVRDYGWRYDPDINSYKLVDAVRSGAERTMLPWKGYWMKALIDCLLVIPVSGMENTPDIPFTAGQATTMSASMKAGTSAGWQVQIIAENGNTKDEYNYFGLNRTNAERMESPLCMENYVELYFTNEKGEGVYASDIRTSLASGDIWNLNVATDKTGEVRLTWDSLETVPSNIKLTLVDDESSISTPITPGSFYTYQIEKGKSRPFRIIVEYK